MTTQIDWRRITTPFTARGWTKITGEVCSCVVSRSVCCCCCCAGAAYLPTREGSRELCWELHGAQFFKMSSLEQRLSRIEEKLKQENEEARRRIDLNIDMSPQRSRPRPSECPPGSTGLSVTARIAELKPSREGGGKKLAERVRRGVGVFC